MTMAMTHPTEVSTRVNLAYGHGRGGRDPNNKESVKSLPRQGV